MPKEEAIQAFELFDKQKKGYLAIKDFQHVMKNLCSNMTEQEIKGGMAYRLRLTMSTAATAMMAPATKIPITAPCKAITKYCQY